MQKQKLKIIFLVFIVSCFSFFSGIKLAFAVNTSTADDDDKRILLEAAHGSGYNKNGWDECNHASNSVDGVTYYESAEARVMIDKIAGYLKQANIPYEISNEVVGDSYFNNPGSWPNSSCNPGYGDCCGFRQGTIGNYSPALYEKIERIGADKYLFAVELHFNASDDNHNIKESNVIVRDLTEPYLSNSKKIIAAVDKVMGTSNGEVRNDSQYLGYTLGAINSLYGRYKIPVYYLETFFMDNVEQLRLYVDKKDELAKEIAQVLVEMAGSSERLEYINSNDEEDDDEDEFTGGRTDDPFKGYPILISSNNFNCKAVLVDINTGELNDVGKLLQDIFDLMKVMAPVIAITLSFIDFLKALAATNPTTERNKALKRTAKRLVIALLLVFLPYLLELLFHVFGLYDISNCNIG